ncbi:hypothetical protein HPB50_000308 [Hyalomma asiaticum]|uniref:Uncharacterized protein n=1 Tax=Hyalomma asiaticum TaxID=266040 RepID=A0ACB7RTT8_HYAAI|nr:hypothetical protein HPB50_000308 [Hyalomma asiaticum]
MRARWLPQFASDGVASGGSAGMKHEFFYSATRTRRPRLVALEDADEMFVQLDNGNLSDVVDTEDEEDDDFIFEEAGSDDCTLETRETSDGRWPKDTAGARAPCLFSLRKREGRAGRS